MANRTTNTRKQAAQRPTVLPCSIFGGRSPKTGKPVGERHRWSGGSWGRSQSEFSHRFLDEVLESRPNNPTM